MASNDYRGYSQDPSEMEHGQARLHPIQSTRGTCRPLVLGTLVVMGVLQVASSVAILLHLTGYLHEVDFSSDYSVTEMPDEGVQVGPIRADALKDPRKKERQRCSKHQREAVPAAHLPIMVPINYVKKGEIQATMIHWKEAQGHLHKIRYHDGRILIQEVGLYVVYVKTCFRYYEELTKPEFLQDGNTQLIQYVYHEKHTQNTIKPMVIMKSGSTKRWKNGVYNMYCEQQSGIFTLKEGDGLFVNVSNSWLLDPDPEGSYFGAFKISN
ncbi:tumor necrosis factor ligand superfamily member 10 isoform X1 [Brienomyrus brachyistius]|uniref:tumor necrosis factor ligand superfamily member 10 isoform X1 n=1 Tax=Brienomyrus brachyistius TaxID=42636 RepID=UPI0020B28FB6|nr:tumor necrosis factor ligand superfamily member 10 isoform X1 [Brienomyrus brachyistius]